ncbi:polysaccharide biosynthesis/export family protein [Mesorhizobium sp. 10J20-29]
MRNLTWCSKRILGVLSLAALASCTSSSGGGPVSSSEVLSLQGQPANDGNLRMVSSLPAPTDTANGQEQPLAPNDVLEVDVFQADSLDRTVQIDPSGRISLPLIGAIQAGGKTVRALESEIEAAYGAKYLQAPDVTVFLKESFGQRVTVDGEVAKAGIYPVSSTSTLIETIALAGGFRDIADQSKVYVYRSVGGQKLVANFNVADIRAGKKANPRIYGGDVVIVFTSQSKVAMNNLKEALGIASSAARIAVLP